MSGRRITRAMSRAATLHVPQHNINSSPDTQDEVSEPPRKRAKIQNGTTLGKAKPGPEPREDTSRPSVRLNSVTIAKAKPPPTAPGVVQQQATEDPQAPSTIPEVAQTKGSRKKAAINSRPPSSNKPRQPRQQAIQTPRAPSTQQEVAPTKGSRKRAASPSRPSSSDPQSPDEVHEPPKKRPRRQTSTSGDPKPTAPRIAQEVTQPIRTRRRAAVKSQPCPHTMTILHSTRALSKEKNQCNICLEDFFDIPPGRDKVIPVRMACGHIFCRECIEIHRSIEVKCPLQWCQIPVPVDPDSCELCANYVRNHSDSLVLTVNALEMTSSIDFTLGQLAEENDFFNIPKSKKRALVVWVRQTLKRFEWQYHPALDLAEMLDPFLCADDRTKAQKLLGRALSAPAPNPRIFPPRINDPDDYPADQEPWIAAFFRQWAIEYEKENGEEKEGWGAWTRRSDQDTDWDFPWKRIVAHKTEPDGTVMYLMKWVGKRYPDSWVSKEQLGNSKPVTAYNKAHGVSHPRQSRKRKRT